MGEKNCRNVIGAQVQKHRNLSRWTQTDFAVRCNLVGLDISRESVSQIERGSRGVSDLEMILLAKALRVNLPDLVPHLLPAWRKDLRAPNATE
jgi:transcriptional regulator with XRE-family HTH domain